MLKTGFGTAHDNESIKIAKPRSKRGLVAFILYCLEFLNMKILCPGMYL